MSLRVIGAGLPRTGTQSLQVALQKLLGGRVYHMWEIPGHPFDLGSEWDTAIAGGTPQWKKIYNGYAGAVDWPTSMFWRELSQEYPDAPVLLSLRDNAQVWWESINGTILPYAREALGPDWSEGRGLLNLLERFAGTEAWDDPITLMDAYDRHNAAVESAIPAERLVKWHANMGWAPLCNMLSLPVPDEPFPWTNQRSQWNQ